MKHGKETIKLEAQSCVLSDFLCEVEAMMKVCFTGSIVRKESEIEYVAPTGESFMVAVKTL